MISKAQIKFVQALHSSKNRKKEGLFIVEGVKLVNELIKSTFEVVSIYATPQYNLPIGATNYPVHRIEQWELEKISVLTTPNQVLALVKMPEPLPLKDVANELVLLLDKVSDPGNMGTIIRTAEWFGIDRVIASSDSVEFWNPKVVQASMGSILRVPLHYVDINGFLSENAHLTIYGTLLDGEELGKTLLTKYGIIVVGNESNGISQEVKEFISRKLTIKPASNAGSESLNASIATAIVCFEFRRQFPA